MKFIPYFSFEGNAEEALIFYADALGGKIQGIMRYSEMPKGEDSQPIPEEYQNKVLHATLEIGDEVIYLSDTFPGMSVTNGNRVEINIAPTSEEELRRVFAKLVVGGTVSMPIDRMFWGSLFGSLTDKYGIGWSLDFQL
jgi:PhnB protein